MKYLFLYTELADYTIKCSESHIDLFPKDEITFISYPVNQEAPFEFEPMQGIQIINQEKLMVEDIWSKIEEINPAVIFCSGWVNKKYLKVIRVARHKYPCVLIVDNPWKGNLKQRLLVPYARLFLKKLFKAAWVPGEMQKKFMKKIGFEDSLIFTGFYATNNGLYTKTFHNNLISKETNFPRVLVCVARYIPQKGLEYLWQAFKEIDRKGWELWMFGSGVNFDERVEAEGIRHFGFTQPNELIEKLGNMGVFILPSLFEPWGMVVHEFAAAGFPLLLSNKVYSAELFLKENENGYFFKPGDVASIKGVLEKVFALSAAELLEMSKKSIELAETNDSSIWSNTLRKISSTFVK